MKKTLYKPKRTFLSHFPRVKARPIAHTKSIAGFKGGRICRRNLKKEGR